MLHKLKSLLQDPPPAMVFEISEAGIAAARIGARAELDFQPLKPGTLTVSPIKENVVDPDEFVAAVRSLAGAQGCRFDFAGLFGAHCGAGFRQLSQGAEGAGRADSIPAQAQCPVRCGD